MVCTRIPKSVRIVTDRIKSASLEMSYRTLLSIVSYFLLHSQSLSDCVRSCSYTSSVSTMAAAVKVFPEDLLLSRIRKRLIKFLDAVSDPNRFIFVLDDTANPKHGKHLYAVGLWGASKGLYKGQRVLCLALVDLKTKKKYPIDFIITKKTKKITMIDHAFNLVEKAVNEGFPKLTVVTDSWFSSIDFIIRLGVLGCHYMGELKSNRKVKTNINPNSPWVPMIEAFNDCKRERVRSHWDNQKIQKRQRRRKTIATKFLQIKNSTRVFKVISVYNKRNEKKGFAYYLSTDLTISGARMWMLSRARWSIECIFRTCKQNLSFGSLSCKSKKASNLAVEMPFYLYASIAIKPEDFGGKEGEPIDRILARIRSECDEKTIELAISGINPLPLESLRVRRSRARASKKPVITIAA